MIEPCPVNLECRLVRTLRFQEKDLFLGEIEAIYAEEKCWSGKKLEMKKIDPLLYSTSDKKYFRVGKEVGKAYRLGKKRA